MTVQDDAREQELCNLFNLSWDQFHSRGGTDAVLNFSRNVKPVRIEFEVKSSTTATVSTARDVGMRHIERWRRKHWVIGFYSATLGSRARLDYALYLTPADMAPWIDNLEAYVRPDFLLAQCAPEKLTESDLIRICGEQHFYSLQDAKKIFKKQWKQSEYEHHLDYPAASPTHYSREKMLHILQQRARYTMERDATLNNPHVTKKFLGGFTDQRITSDFAQALRTKLTDYLGSGN